MHSLILAPWTDRDKHVERGFPVICGRRTTGARFHFLGNFRGKFARICHIFGILAMVRGTSSHSGTMHIKLSVLDKIRTPDRLTDCG
jgi:hypothetical protein